MCVSKMCGLFCSIQLDTILLFPKEKLHCCSKKPISQYYKVTDRVIVEGCTADVVLHCILMKTLCCVVGV